jgi:hypothetical protein
MILLTCGRDFVSRLPTFPAVFLRKKPAAMLAIFSQPYDWLKAHDAAFTARLLREGEGGIEIL